jgi:hypothetical protein
LSNFTPNACKSRSCSRRSSATANRRNDSTVGKIVPDLVEIPLRELADVLAVVAVVGKRPRARRGSSFARARTDNAKIVDLRTGVVIVELARHIGAPATRSGARSRRRAPPGGLGQRAGARFGFAETNSTITRSPLALLPRP